MARHDELIDRVARQMTEADPPGDFRVRVIAGLPTARPQPWWHLAALAGSGIVAGMLIMTAVSVWSHRSSTPTAASTHAERTGVTRGGIPVNGTSGTPAPVLPFGARPGGATNIGSRVGPAGSAGPMEPAGPIDPPFPFLSIAPLQPSELSIAPIVVGPIVTGSIALPPIVK
jgi:hypothetical protein